MIEIQLDGAEITVLKAVGVGGGITDGETLIDRVSGLENSEFIDTLKGLIMLGYLLCDKNSLHELEDIKTAKFHVNSGYSKALREAMDPKGQQPKRSRRVRRE
jgi:hypothetical protein